MLVHSEKGSPTNMDQDARSRGMSCKRLSDGQISNDPFLNYELDPLIVN